VGVHGGECRSRVCVAWKFSAVLLSAAPARGLIGLRTAEATILPIQCGWSATGVLGVRRIEAVILVSMR
jgi:hypothetical protein